MDMASDGSVTRWVQALAQSNGGESLLEEQLFHRYFERLASVAQRRLANSSRAIADEEDVALSAMASFFRRAREGQFAELADRGELWRLLVTITNRKAINQYNKQTAAKRDMHRELKGDAASHVEHI